MPTLRSRPVLQFHPPPRPLLLLRAGKGQQKLAQVWLRGARSDPSTLAGVIRALLLEGGWKPAAPAPIMKAVDTAAAVIESVTSPHAGAGAMSGVDFKDAVQAAIEKDGTGLVAAFFLGAGFGEGDETEERKGVYRARAAQFQAETVPAMKHAACRAAFGIDSPELAAACMEGVLDVLLVPSLGEGGKPDRDIVRRKLMTLEFLKCKHLFSEQEALWPLVIASSDSQHQVKQAAAKELKQQLSAAKLKEPRTIDALCSLFLGVRVNAWPVEIPLSNQESARGHTDRLRRPIHPLVTSRYGSPLLLLTCALLMTSSHSEGRKSAKN